MIPTLETLDAFEAALAARAAVLVVETEQVPIAALAPDWTADESRLGRPDGRFHRAIGIHVKPVNREVRDYKQVIFAGETDARIIMAVDGSNGSVLLRFKGEAGNVGYELEGKNSRVLAAPTVQYSVGNLKHNQLAKAASGDFNEVPLTELLHQFTAEWSPSSADGARFLDKREWFAAIVLGSDRTMAANAAVVALGAASADFAWVTPTVLKDAIRRGWCNNFVERLAARL